MLTSTCSPGPPLPPPEASCLRQIPGSELETGQPRAQDPFPALCGTPPALDGWGLLWTLSL